VRVAGDLARLLARIGPYLPGLAIRLLPQAHQLLAAGQQQLLGVLTGFLGDPLSLLTGIAEQPRGLPLGVGSDLLA